MHFEKDKFTKQFNDEFGDSGQPLRYYFAPGRVCLMGEHLDYNGGPVIPAAISLGIFALFRRRNDKIILLKSPDMKQVGSFEADEEFDKIEHNSWLNYPLGVFRFLADMGFQFSGCEIMYCSTVPIASGLSSSASLEVLTAFMLSENFEGPEMNRVKMAQLCMDVENNFVGLPCGIMDQFASALGKAGHAILLECNSLQYRYIRLQTEPFKLVIINTNKPRVLTESAFKTRKNECVKALKILQQHVKVSGLAMAEIEDVNKYIADETLRKRASYFCGESKRVYRSATLLESGQTEAFGLQMYQSHEGLKTQYEVTGLELDTIVEASKLFPGCIGARMTGAGFGGCAIALVHQDFSGEYKNHIQNIYVDATGMKADFYEIEFVDGVRECR